ncbi:MAG: hypothetical protein HPY59_18700 [Anaerolineae bacterium]|nr:hypothetical protein [Anaerolineae bacterium]
MPAKTPSRNKNGSSRVERQRRLQRIIFVVFAVIIILSWIISLVVAI